VGVTGTGRKTEKEPGELEIGRKRGSTLTSLAGRDCAASGTRPKSSKRKVTEVFSEKKKSGMWRLKRKKKRNWRGLCCPSL